MTSKLPITGLIDHAVLHPTQTMKDLHAACELCANVGAFSVCVKPYMIAEAFRVLNGSGVLVSTVIGFPHGSQPFEVKAHEAKWACEQGAHELDMVVNIGQAFAGEWGYVEEDIRAVVEAGKAYQALTKVIFETDMLTDEATKIELCKVSERAGACFVKTSTGFGLVKQADGSMATRGATDADIILMRKSCSTKMGVKASGGIRSFADAKRLVGLGATRLGTSATAAIAAEEKALAEGRAVEKSGSASSSY